MKNFSLVLTLVNTLLCFGMQQSQPISQKEILDNSSLDIRFNAVDWKEAFKQDLLLETIRSVLDESSAAMAETEKRFWIRAPYESVGATADISEQYGIFGNTPLHVAAECGNKKAVLLLIAYGADVNARNKVGDTPLHCAAICGHLEVMQMLIDNGADVDAQNNLGYTPLHTAAERDDRDVARLLLKCGANVDAQNHTGETPADCAARCYKSQEIQILLTPDKNSIFCVKIEHDEHT